METTTRNRAPIDMIDKDNFHKWSGRILKAVANWSSNGNHKLDFHRFMTCPEGIVANKYIICKKTVSILVSWMFKLPHVALIRRWPAIPGTKFCINGKPMKARIKMICVQNARILTRAKRTVQLYWFLCAYGKPAGRCE